MKHNGTRVHCSGALVSSKYVLSASHCFVDKQGELVVALGVNDIKELRFFPHQELNEVSSCILPFIIPTT